MPTEASTLTECRQTPSVLSTKTGPSPPYANGQQTMADVSNSTAESPTIPSNTHSLLIQAVGGNLYFSHDGTDATSEDFVIAAGDTFVYDGDPDSVSLLSSAATGVDARILYFK